jgi:hypothetical protein
MNDCTYTNPLAPPIILWSQIVSYGRNEGMKLCKESNSPHDVHGSCRQHESRSPNPVRGQVSQKCPVSPSSPLLLLLLLPLLYLSLKPSSQPQYTWRRTRRRERNRVYHVQNVRACSRHHCRLLWRDREASPPTHRDFPTRFWLEDRAWMVWRLSSTKGWCGKRTSGFHPLALEPRLRRRR